MHSKQLLQRIFLIPVIITAFATMGAYGQDSTRGKPIVKERLPIPFGTLVKMTIEIYDGDELNDKGHMGSYLFKIKSIDSIPLPKPITIEFEDETGSFPRDEFELYKYLYGKKTGTITSKQSDKMRKKYVGKEFNIIAYETGQFTGIPDGYFKYQPVRQDYGFHFRHYIIVVSDLTKVIAQ